MAEKNSIDLLLEEQEAAEKKAAKEAKNVPATQKMGVKESMLRSVVPSSKNMRVGTASDIWPGSWAKLVDNTKTALRLGGEALTYPVRIIGGVANAFAGNPRGGDYGIGETFEESGQGYKEYNFPIAGQFSPMGKVQEMMHDPLNAVGMAASRFARPAATLAGKVFSGAGINTIQEASRPIAMDVGNDHIGNVLGAGLTGGGFGAAGHGAGKLLGNLGMMRSRLTPQQYNELLLRLARKNNVSPSMLDEAATAQARTQMKKHYKTEANISDDLLDYKHFDETKFPENKTFHEFLDRSQTTVTPDDAVKHLTDYGKRTREAAGGGGLTTVEQATQRRLPKEAEIFYEQNPEAPPSESLFEVKVEKPVLLNAQGQQIVRSENPPRKVREMTAKELNNARQRIGQLLEDDFKREQMGRPDGEVKALKDAYFATRKHIMDIMDKEGETAAIEAYKKMGSKLGAREALFEALTVPNNKYKAQDALTRRLPNIYGNNKKAQVWAHLQDFDKNFETDFANRVKWNNMANQLGEGVGSHDFRLKGDNNWFTGKGWRSPFAKLTDRWTGGTVDAAARKLEAAKADQPGFSFGMPTYIPPIYSRPEMQFMNAVQEKGEDSPEAQAIYNTMPIESKNRVIDWLNF